MAQKVPNGLQDALPNVRPSAGCAPIGRAVIQNHGDRDACGDGRAMRCDAMRCAVSSGKTRALGRLWTTLGRKMRQDRFQIRQMSRTSCHLCENRTHIRPHPHPHPHATTSTRSRSRRMMMMMMASRMSCRADAAGHPVASSLWMGLNASHGRLLGSNSGSRMLLRERMAHMSNIVRMATVEGTSSSSNSEKNEEVEVEDLLGVRLVRDDSGRPTVQYLVRWQDDYDDSWENAQNLSEDLLRRFEDKWWLACKKGDYDEMVTMLMGGKEALVAGVDDNRRSALHYTAGTGNMKCTKLLLSNGAEVDLRDKDGYTPLHIASGYMHKDTVRELLEYGADPEVKDNNDRSPLELVESLLKNLPPNPTLFTRRIALEQVIEEFYKNVYEEVVPKQILEARAIQSTSALVTDQEPPSVSQSSEDMITSGREFLVEWFEDDIESSWVPSKHLASDLIEDFDGGFEYANAKRILEKRELKETRARDDSNGVSDEEEGPSYEYLIEWEDDYPNSWETKDSISQTLIDAFDNVTIMD